jgi:hypothetical protein
VTTYSNDTSETVRLIAELRIEHRDLDEAIARLSEDLSTSCG